MLVTSDAEPDREPTLILTEDNGLPTWRPEPMWPVLRLSHRFSVTPVSSHFHFDGSAGTLRSAGSCARSRAYLAGQHSIETIGLYTHKT